MALESPWHPSALELSLFPFSRLQEALKKAKGGTIPPPEELYSNIWVAGEKYETPVTPGYIRMPDRTKSIGNIVNDVAV